MARVRHRIPSPATRGTNTVARSIVRLAIMAVGTLVVFGQYIQAEEPSSKKDDAKKELPALAKEVVKVEVTGAVDGKRTTKTIEDKKKIGELLTLFPEVGTREEYKMPRGSAAQSHLIILHFEKVDPISIHVHQRHNDWLWSQRDTEGRLGRYGLWELNKEVPKFLAELLK